MSGPYGQDRESGEENRRHRQGPLEDGQNILSKVSALVHLLFTGTSGSIYMVLAVFTL